jgi:hypothetical protein
MTLEELEQSLPNGFHDSLVEELSVNYNENSAFLKLNICLTAPGDSAETFRPAKLCLNELSFIAIDPPSPRDLDSKPYRPSPGGLKIDGTVADEKILPSFTQLRREIPDNVQIYSLYVNNWNSYVHIAVQEARLEWLA